MKNEISNVKKEKIKIVDRVLVCLDVSHHPGEV